MLEDRPPPGPRPDGFIYPFSAMAEAHEVAGALADRLENLVRGHERYAADAVVGFEGEARAEFDLLFGAAMEGVIDLVRGLRDQAGQIADDHLAARARQRAADDELAAWHNARNAWLGYP